MLRRFHFQYRSGPHMSQATVVWADEGRRRLDGQGPGGKKRDSHGGHRRDRTDLWGLVTDCHHGAVTSGVAGNRS